MVAVTASDKRKHVDKHWSLHTLGPAAYESQHGLAMFGLAEHGPVGSLRVLEPEPDHETADKMHFCLYNVCLVSLKKYK